MDGMTDVRIGGEGGGGKRLNPPPGSLAKALVRAIRCAAHLGLSFPTRGTIGSWMGNSKSAVSAAMRLLKADGTIEEDKYGINHRYRVLPDGKWTEWRDGSPASWAGMTPAHMAIRRAMLDRPAEPAGDDGGAVEVEGEVVSPPDDGGLEVHGGLEVRGPVFTGVTGPWPAAADGKIVATRPAPAPDDPLYAKDFVAILRDRRANLATTRLKVSLAIEHIDGLLHFLAPEGDGSEVEKTA